MDGSTIVVDTSMNINESQTYDGYFTIFSDGERVDYSSIGRDPADPTRVLIEFPSPLSGDVEVRYMPPDDTPLYSLTGEAVHGLIGGLKLPLPAFNGPVEPLPRDSFPGLRMAEE
jgi:hypothetical protein